MAIVFPTVMLMLMVSGGAMGGGSSSASARALGAGKRDEANALVLHGIVVNLALGCAYASLMLIFGSALLQTLGKHAATLGAALQYANIVFAGSLAIWLVNALALALVRRDRCCGGVARVVPGKNRLNETSGGGGCVVYWRERLRARWARWRSTW